MREQAQLAKLRRILIGTLARMGGARLIPVFKPGVAERAALNLRAVNGRHVASISSPVTTFAIPLVGAHQVSQWSVIEATLERTLLALLAQSDQNWRAVICSQTRPKAVDLDPRITHLPFDADIQGHDKVAKLDALTQHCLRNHSQSGFFMPLDGDDLLHREFVASLHACPNHGLLVSGGYIADAGNGALGRTRARSLSEPLQKPFWKFCGSCMALPTGEAPEQEADFFAALALHEHRLYPYLAELAGYRLNRCTAPRALYIINHGENFETRRGRGGFKQRFVARNRVSDADELNKIFHDFPGAEQVVTPHKADP